MLAPRKTDSNISMILPLNTAPDILECHDEVYGSICMVGIPCLLAFDISPHGKSMQEGEDADEAGTATESLIAVHPGFNQKGNRMSHRHGEVLSPLLTNFRCSIWGF